MPYRDEIDLTLAKYFAWIFVGPGEEPLVEARLKAAHDAAQQRERHARGRRDRSAPHLEALPDGATAEPFRSRALAACRALATEISSAWKCSGDEARLRAAKRLLARADRLGIELLGIHQWPLEAVRLVRLLVECAPRMSRRQRERSANVATLVPLQHPETAELFVELARAGARAMADALLSDDDWAPEVGGEGTLVARLAEVIDHGTSTASRVVAIELIARFRSREAVVATLRGALRFPSFAVRGRALAALATVHPCAVTPDDLTRVLRDLVAHAIPDALSGEEHERDERIFGDAVLLALKHVRTDETAEALLDWIDAEHSAAWLDAGWATEALAVGFPDTAAAMVDHWLKCARGHDRLKALGALARLPEHLAEPRLLLAASDPVPSVREAAQRQWLGRFGRACPTGLERVVGAALLVDPPGEVFASRLAVMQGRVPEARRAMVRALLSQPPGREELVLLLQFIADDAESAEPTSSTKPFSEEGGWAATIVERFGAPGVEGLCAIAERFPEPESFGWMRRLGTLVERGAISSEQMAPLRALAARHVASEKVGCVDDALRLLGLVGAPSDLLGRVLSVALDGTFGSWQARELIVSWPDRAVDVRLASEMALAAAEHDWDRLQHASSMALGRKAPAAKVIAQRVLEIAEQNEDAVDAAVECARRLRELGVLDDAWALAALGRRESPIFCVAARAWGKSDVVRERLEAALGSPARLGASAAQAAIALLNATPPLSPRDRRLPSILAGAQPVHRAELLQAMCIHGAPLAQVAPALEALLTSSDERVTRALLGAAHWLRSPKAQAFLRGLLPRVVDAELRRDIEEHLGAAPAPFWVES